MPSWLCLAGLAITGRTYTIKGGCFVLPPFSFIFLDYFSVPFHCFFLDQLSLFLYVDLVIHGQDNRS